jgi:hypothetical protein
MDICGAFWRKTKLMAGNYPFSRRHRGPAHRFVRFCFVRSPRARLGKSGMAWARRMDEIPNPGENKEPGARLGRISPSGCKKWRLGAESGGQLEMPLARNSSTLSVTPSMDPRDCLVLFMDLQGEHACRGQF